MNWPKHRKTDRTRSWYCYSISSLQTPVHFDSTQNNSLLNLLCIWIISCISLNWRCNWFASASICYFQIYSKNKRKKLYLYFLAGANSKSANVFLSYQITRLSLATVLWIAGNSIKNIFLCCLCVFIYISHIL